MSLDLSANPPLGIYLHFPFCAQRCPYCDFTLTTRAFSHERYADAILAEFKARLAQMENAPALTSLYFGGGTPGLWDPQQLQRVISHIGAALGWQKDAEITLEANPSELTLQLAEQWREAGINRLSLGTQSFRMDRLQWLGRTHTPDQARQAVTWAREAGFSNLNLDLMHGFVDQTISEALEDLEQTLALNPEHISLYQLTVEERTVFGSRAKKGEKLIEPEEHLVALYEALSERLQQAKYPLYEVSNAARRGFESRHNQLYWTLGQYLALGAGAHGLLWNQAQGQMRGIRWSNIKQPEKYMSAALEGALKMLEEESETLNQEALYEEQILVGFRLYRGFKVSEGLRNFIGARADVQIQAGLMFEEQGYWRATDQGRLLLNRLIMNLLT